METNTKQPITEQQINQPATQRLQKEEKYQKFLHWLRENGTLIDQRVTYPTAFGPNQYVGVSCSADIEPYKAIIAIPKKIIIDVDKVKQLPQFSAIFQQNPRMFNGKEQTDAAFNTLSLFLIYEQLKGNKSFFHPYFQAGQCKNLLLHWTKSDLEQIQNRQILQHVQAYKDELDFQFMNFLRIVRKYDKIFPADINNETYQRMFEWASEFVMTRAFGWSVPSASLIPFADMLNHGESYLDHFLTDVERERGTEITSQKQVNSAQQLNVATENIVPNNYIMKKKWCDLSLFKQQHLQLTSQQLAQLQQPKPTARLKHITKHQNLLENDAEDQNERVNKIAYKQYAEGKRNLRQLNFVESSCSQDNDTEDDELTDFAYKTEKFIIDDKAILKGQNQTPLKVTLKRYWDLYEQTKTKAKKNSSKQQKSPNSSQQDNRQYDFLQQSFQQQSSVENTSSQDEQEFTWMSSSKQQNVYFVLYTNRRYLKNEQLYNFYGRRSNRFLLLGYNFATLSNKYDSFCFRMVVEPLSIAQPVVSKLIFSNHITLKQSQTCIITKQLRLKKQRVCIELINHCRCLLFPKFVKEKQVDWDYEGLDKAFPVIIPTSKSLEQSALALAKQIVQYQLMQYTSSVEKDERIVSEGGTPSRLYTAVVIRLVHKRILIKQLRLLDKCLEFLGRWNEGKIELRQDQMEDVRKVKTYLYELQRSKL